MRTQLLVFCLAIGFGNLLQSQAPELRFESITVANGLPDNHVRSLYQDRRGFLWIGTQNGLVRYDGRYCQQFLDQRGPDSLSGNVVSAVLEDRAGIIWVGTLGGGITRLDMRKPEGQRATHFAHLPGPVDGLPTTRIHALYQFNDTTVLVGAEGVPLLFLNTQKQAFSCWDGAFPLHPSRALPNYQGNLDWCHAIMPIGGDELWLSFLINRNNPIVQAKTGVFLREGLSNTDDILTFAAIQTAGENLVAGGWTKGLVLRDRVGITPNRLIDLPDEVVSLVPWGKDQVLAGTKNSGLMWVDLKSGKFQNYAYNRFSPTTVISDHITCLFSDRDNALWVGTEQGLSVYRPWSWRFTSTSVFPGNEMDQSQLLGNEIYESEEGTLRICTSKGIFKKMPGNKPFQRLNFEYEGKQIQPYGFFPTPTFGTILGTETGFFAYNEKEETIRPFPLLPILGTPDSFRFPLYDLFQVRSVQEDTFENRPVLVAGALGWGVYTFDFQGHYLIEFLHKTRDKTSLQSNLTRKLIYTPGKPYWVATSGGLFRWELDRANPNNTFTSFFHEPLNPASLPANEVIDGCYDQQGTLWVLTRGVLSRFNGDRFTHFAPSRNFHGPFYDLELLQDGRMALGTQGGVQFFDPATGQFSYVSFARVGFKPGDPVRVKALKNGKIGIFSANTWVEFHPDSMGIQVSPPALYLSGMWANGRFLQEALQVSEVHLRYNEQPIVVRLGAMGLHQADNFQIEYQVKGLDDTWKPLPDKGELTYYQVPSGTFPLLVRWVDASGKTGAPIRLSTWIIKPPFWTTWWFILAVILSVTALVYGLYQFRLSQMIRAQAVRMRIAGDLHDEVGSALSSIAIGSELASHSLSNDPAKAALLLDRMRKTSMQTLEDMGDIIWAIHPRNDPGDSLIAKMKRVVADLLESKGIQVVFESDPKVDDLYLTMEARKNLFLIFKEAVHNIAKHAQCDQVVISMQVRHYHLELDIQDNGKGFSEENNLGHGLESMRRRAQDLGAQLIMDQKSGQGVHLLLKVAIPKVRKQQ